MDLHPLWIWIEFENQEFSFCGVLIPIKFEMQGSQNLDDIDVHSFMLFDIIPFPPRNVNNKSGCLFVIFGLTEDVRWISYNLQES